MSDWVQIKNTITGGVSKVHRSSLKVWLANDVIVLVDELDTEAVDQFQVGNSNWYDINGEKVQGRETAKALLEAETEGSSTDDDDATTLSDETGDES